MRNSVLPGFLFYAFGIFMMAAMDALAKFLGTRYPVGELVFFRSLFGFLPLVPFVLRYGRAALVTFRLPMQFARGACMLSAVFLVFLSLQLAPLPQVATLFITQPLFVIALSWPLLQEKVGWASATAVALGFLGALLVIRPDQLMEGIGAFAPLGAALFAALAMITTRQLARTESASATLFYGNLLVLAFSMLSLPLGWVTPSAVDWFLLTSLGVVGGISVYSIIVACRYVPVNRLAALDYLRVIWAVFFGYTIWQEVLPFWGWMGALLVVGAGLYTTRDSRRLADRPQQ